MTEIRKSISIACVALLAVAALIAEPAQLQAPEINLDKATPQEFLNAVREPLRTDAWGEINGRITHAAKNRDNNLKGEIRVRITFAKQSLHAQIVLNDKNVYALEQANASGKNTSIKLDFPKDEAKPSLFDFGLEPEDLTFAFIYWDFIEELPRVESRMRDCRIMRLADPTGKGGTVLVWFDTRHGFPMEAQWFEKNAQAPWRKLELKGAKRHKNGLWFVKEMRLEAIDKSWKTQVKFDHAEINPVEN
ncbi:MAG: hypothetical protein GX561_01625 [Lentisphaerae bacterium]|jgi:hypothetical protein|nr:hypothetical protein [Lentisphaerota bacterium]